MACSKLADTILGYAITTWCWLILAISLLAPTLAHCQDQFEKRLSDNPAVTFTNIKYVDCNSEAVKSPTDKDAVIAEKCAITFLDGATQFQASLRYCANFEQCDAAGGKFKDILVKVLRVKKALIAKR
jgi:hypothetical protein